MPVDVKLFAMQAGMFGRAFAARFAPATLLVAVAMAGAAVEVWAVSDGWAWVSAALDLLAGWSLVAAAGWATQVSAGCRVLLGLAGVCWFLATPQVVGGTAGHAAAPVVVVEVLER